MSSRETFLALRRYANVCVRALVLVLVLPSPLSGCSSLWDDRPPEEKVASRAQKHLEALKDQQWDKALAYTTRGFRTSHSAEQYGFRYKGAPKWLGVRIGEVDCDSPAYTVCEVATYITTHQPMVRMQIERYRSRKWLRIDGQWFIHEAE